MTLRPNGNAVPTPEAMVAKMAPSIERAAAERASAKANRRAQFPLMAEMTDLFRNAGMDPRPVYARNGQGEEWGHNPDPVSAAALAAPLLTNTPYDQYQEFWRKALGKKAETYATYRERMQRAIKPGMRAE